MKSIGLWTALSCASLLGAADDLASWFAEGTLYGNVKYYYIETDKDDGAGTTTSAHANAVGGQLGYETAPLYGLQLGATFMTTNPFALPEAVDTSIIGKDNGVRGGDPEAGFAVLGEAYLQYRRGGDYFTNPSRFLDDVPEKLLEPWTLAEEEEAEPARLAAPTPNLLPPARDTSDGLPF